MSISARQNFWKPPPVPEMPTVTRVSLSAFWNSSATASLIGNTVLEPSRLTSDGPEVAGAPRASVLRARAAAQMRRQAAVPTDSAERSGEVTKSKTHAASLCGGGFAAVSGVLIPCRRGIRHRNVGRQCCSTTNIELTCTLSNVIFMSMRLL